LSSWLRERADGPLISDFFFDEQTADQLGQVFKMVKTPNFQERIKRLLTNLDKEVETLDDSVEISRFVAKWIALSWSTGDNELLVIIRYLEEEGIISDVSKRPIDLRNANRLPDSIGLTPKGFIEIDHIKSEIVESNKGFVAMWFSETVKPLYERCIAPAIGKAGYEPMIMNRLEHVNRIDDEIEVQIKGSKFVVADFTGQRGGVYYEAGFARGLGKPVIWTAHKWSFKQMHFDIKQFNCLTWIKKDWEGDIQDTNSFCHRLAFRIENVCGKGQKSERYP
jgi:hypothetical protein